jgi:transcriptional antiterminator RfaH
MWSVCQVLPHQTHIAVRNLERQGYGYFNPIYETKKLRRKKLVTVQAPLFFSYLFVEIRPEQRWVPINSTMGVSKLLTRRPDGSEYLEPCAISDAFITRLMACSHCSRQDNGGVTWTLLPGTRVTLTAGPFAGLEGELASWPSGDRVRLILYLLNRQTVVTVSVGDVAAI